MTDATLRTNAKRVAAALAAGALAGGVLSTGAIVVLDDYANGRGSLAGDRAGAYFILSTVIYLAGLAVAGGPIWAALHFTGRRRLWMAVTLGAVLNGVALALFGFNAETAWKWIAVYAVIGAVVGAVVWRVAYETPTAPALTPRP